jgi:Xaa-Pro aminopeptidase
MRKQITDLREQMYENGMDAYYVPSADYHNSEYFCDYFRACTFLSGMTGEAAELVVTEDGAYLWTDGRFFLQAGTQLAGSGIELMRMGEEGVPTVEEFLKSKVEDFKKSHESDDYVIGFDGRVVPRSFGEKLEKTFDNETRVRFKWDEDLVGNIWQDRPAIVSNGIWQLPVSEAGTSASEKIEAVRGVMEAKGADYLLVTDLMETAWLLNLRGSDIEYTPVFFSYVLLGHDSLILYAMPDAIDAGIPDIECKGCFEVRPYEQIYEDLRGNGAVPDGSKVWLDLRTTNYSLYLELEDRTEIYDGYTPVALAKIVKNDTELRGMQQAHIEDAAAVIRTIRWVKEKVRKTKLTEIDISDKLKEERLAQEGCFDLSFETITGYGPNGAIIHYTPERGRDAVLKPEGFLLIDSGGQYRGGTTDITRTITLGEIDSEMKKVYTLVLKGHVALSRFIFSAEMDGTEAEEASRKAIKAAGYNFNHGVSHGVGHVLAVHEGPNAIGRKPCPIRIRPGMVMSNEPGIYLEDKFGVRIENMMYIVDVAGGIMASKPLTLVPYEREAIEVSMLTPEEISWVDSYHKRIRKTVGPLLSGEDLDFLHEITKPLAG